jgi:hypothetical protein
MRWFRRKPSGAGEPDFEKETQQSVSELLDRYHPRASISDGDHLLLEPGQVLENIAFAMERMDTDINTSVSIEEDVVAFDELATLVQSLRMGPLIAVHVVNTAMRIMSARYPMELVRAPLPERYDLRKLYPLNFSDREHETARTIFNQRAASPADLDEEDVAAALESLGSDGQIQVFVALVYMFGSKVGAMKYRTGIE